MSAFRSCATAAITVSTASSPSFLAALSMPAAKSLAVQESASSARARSATIVSSFFRSNRLMSAPRDLWAIEPHGNSRIGHVLFGFGDRIGSEMKDRGRKHGSRMPVANALHEVIQGADAARRDHRYANGIGNGTGQRDVVAGLGAVAIH